MMGKERRIDFNMNALERLWRINVVNSINERSEYMISNLDSLDRGKAYSVHIEYPKGTGFEPVREHGLNYEELRETILGNLVVPSNLLMNI